MGKKNARTSFKRNNSSSESLTNWFTSTSSSASRLSNSSGLHKQVLDMTDLPTDYSDEQTWGALLFQCGDIIDDLIRTYADYHDEMPVFCDGKRPCNSVFSAEQIDNSLCNCYLSNNEHFFDNYLPRKLKVMVAGVPPNFAFPSLAKRKKHLSLRGTQTPVRQPGSSLVTRSIITQHKGSTSPAPGELNTRGLGANANPGTESSPTFLSLATQNIIQLLESEDDLPVILDRNPVVLEVGTAISPILRDSSTCVRQGSEPLVASPEVLGSPSQGLALTLGNTTETPGNSQVHSTNVEFIAVDSEVAIRGPSNSTPKPSRQGSPNPPLIETPKTPAKTKSSTPTQTNVSPNTSIQGTPQNRHQNCPPALYLPFTTSETFGSLSNSMEALQKYCNNKQINFKLGNGPCTTIKIWPEGKRDHQQLSQISTLDHHPFQLLSAAPAQPIRYTIHGCPESYIISDIKRAFYGAYQIMPVYKVHKGNKVRTAATEFTLDRELSETVKIKSRTHNIERSPIELVDCFNCHALGHHGKTCKTKTWCGKCAKEHQTRTCNTDKSEWVCARCIQAKYDGPHQVHSSYAFSDCPIRRQAIAADNRRRLADKNKSKGIVQTTCTTSEVIFQEHKHTLSLQNREKYAPPQHTRTSNDVSTQLGRNKQQAANKVNNQPLTTQSTQLAEQSRTIQQQSDNIVHTTLLPTQTTQATQHVGSEQRNSLDSAMQMAQHNIVMLNQMCNDGYQERHALKLNMKRLHTEICDIKSVNSVLTHRVNQLQQWQQSVVPNMVIQDFKQFLAHRQEFTNFLSLKYNR